MEDTRRAMVMSSPRELAVPDDFGVFRWNGWRGVEWRGGRGMWQTEKCWGTVIADFPGERGRDWHITRRDYCVDLETCAMPEGWWKEWFGGVRGKNLRAAMPDGAEDVVFETVGSGKDECSLKGSSVYVGTARSPVRLRMYTKYLRPGMAVNVRQEHMDRWASAGWTGGLVVRCEFETHPPAEMNGSVSELWADCAARIRLLNRPRDRCRASDVETAERWAALGGEVKRFREKKAPDEKTAKLKRAVERLVKEHGHSELSLMVLLSKLSK